jgi:SAM-dependent methyltransferase
VATLDEIKRQTISDFGQQWSFNTANDGYYGSVDLLNDIIAPFLTGADVAGKQCAEIGAGTGRIVLMLAAAGASRVTAIEPSSAHEVLLENTAGRRSVIECVKTTGDQIPQRDFDLVLSIGVIHHIPEPKPVLDAAWRSLRPGGRILIWLYGREGNGLYLALAQPIRAITKRLPARVNAIIASALYYAGLPYAWLASRIAWLPLHGYLASVFMKFEPAKRKLVVLDQINPTWARYYRRHEAERLLSDSGFADVQCHHRHGYSWTVTGIRAS